jgi:hypothetical protein
VDDGNGLEAFRLQPGSVAVGGAESCPTWKRGRKRIPRQLGAFIRGPIPLAWLDGVLKLPGRVPLVVALALLYQSGLESSPSVRVTHKLLQRFGIPPRTSYDVLAKLEAAGLVVVTKLPGRCRVVKILPGPLTH